MTVTIPMQHDPRLVGDAEAFDRLMDEATARLRAGEKYDAVVDWWAPQVSALLDAAAERMAGLLLGGVS